MVWRKPKVSEVSFTWQEALINKNLLYKFELFVRYYKIQTKITSQFYFLKLLSNLDFLIPVKHWFVENKEKMIFPPVSLFLLISFF